MITFLRKRVLSSAVPLVCVVLGVFLLARMTGNPVDLYLPLSATAEQRAEFSAAQGFDLSIPAQLWNYLVDAVRFDFGTSLRTGQSAGSMVIDAFPVTLQLAGVTMLLAITGALVVGSLAAYRPNSLIDRIASLLSMTAASIPDFWFAIMGVLVLGVSLGVLPTSGTIGGPEIWVLPIATLLIRPFGVLVQVVRGSMVTALSAPYVKVARSKGASPRRVVFGHALRNAVTPVLTVAGDLTVGLVNGAVIVETIFGWPGIGKLMIDSILQRDFAVLQAAVLMTAVTIFALNILVDVCHALTDPRVRQAVPA
ncbi:MULTISPECIES: ABC transporter permease [unclassified Streptomyces]|uniref:ABC transporter permease n=1 Tax=unclassified Streptomyces TaxID=2593676 RepID=UPI00093D539A|nr:MULTISPECIES: ABC transporter permease [unclassified Streptomyces]MCX5414549.1 ABC transporter permease [Streptomyces sp. NBC_00059]OKI92530.1 ABC transporter permease [Streptomyces sp. CB02058]